MKFKRVCIFLVLILIIICCTFFGRYYLLENSELKSSTDKEVSEKVIENPSEKGIINILFLGIDKQENASDTIMILSINKEKETLKLVSIMRDLYIYQGEGKANKINYAYHYGGTEGSINTINTIFNLNISKYVKINFEDLISIVDQLGGIEVEINESERKYINIVCGKEAVKNSGRVLLDGEEALAFSRIRKIDSDFQRTARQRKVIIAIAQKIKDNKLYRYPKIIYNLKNASETNLSRFEILKYSYLISSYNNSIAQLRIPIDGTSRDNTSGVYHLDWDEEINKKTLSDFLNN